MKVAALGIDLAKSIFRLYGVDTRGVVVLRRQVTRKQLLPSLARLSPCLVGMEACAGGHYWAREIGNLGHTVKLMSPHFVAPYRKSRRTMATTPRRSAKRSDGHQCGLCRRRPPASRMCRRCIAYALS